MGLAEIIVGILMIILSIVIIAVILFQQSRRSGVGVVSGSMDTFLSKNKARDMESRLSRLTKYIAIIFFVLAVVANAIALAK